MQKILKKENMGKLLKIGAVLSIMFLICNTSFASEVGDLGIISTAEKYMKFIQVLFKYITGFAIVATTVLVFMQRPIWMAAAGIVIVAAVIANLDKVLGVFGFAGSTIFL